LFLVCPFEKETTLKETTRRTSIGLFEAIITLSHTKSHYIETNVAFPYSTKTLSLGAVWSGPDEI